MRVRTKIALCRGCWDCGSDFSDPAISAHNGRVVSRTGEGISSSFVASLRPFARHQAAELVSGARSSCALAFFGVPSFGPFVESGAAMTVFAVKT
jgi:hypothetical protein